MRRQLREMSEKLNISISTKMRQIEVKVMNIHERMNVHDNKKHHEIVEQFQKEHPNDLAKIATWLTGTRVSHSSFVYTGTGIGLQFIPIPQSNLE